MTTNHSHVTTIEPKFLTLFAEYVFKNFGIYIEEPKKKLLEMKLVALMRDENIVDISNYYHLIASPPITENQKRIRNSFIDTVTIHKTNFFRENNHFEFIKKNISKIITGNPHLKYSNELRVWSAASSTGEEPYTLAMLFSEILPAHMKVKILATDISPKSVQSAVNGVYKFGPEDNITSDYIRKYFTPVGNKGEHQISDEIKKMVTFRLFNLMDPFPFKNPFDIIFCRNVMIYFNREVQGQVINKFYDSMATNGLLFIGHSESLIQLQHKFKYEEPTIYKKM